MQSISNSRRAAGGWSRSYAIDGLIVDWFTLAGIAIALVLVLTIAIMGGWIGGRKPPSDQ
jgi:hypothetical protein